MNQPTRRLRILHYTGVYAPAWKWGGPPRSNANLAEGLVALGHEVTVFTTNAGLEADPSIPTDRPVIRNGVSVHYFPAESNFMGLQSRKLEAAVRARVRDFDLIHVTGVWQPTSVAACRAAERARVPYVVSPRGSLSPYSWGQKRWKKLLYWRVFERRNCARASLIHYTAKVEQEECSRLRLPVSSVVVPNAIELSSWYRDALEGVAWRRRVFPFAEKAKIALYSGRLHHKKGLDLLPQVMSGLDEAGHRDLHLAFVGGDEDGTLRELSTEFARNGLLERVVFLPTATSAGLRAAYSGADVLLLPSRHENFGNVVVEALACGCPVMISDQVGAAEFVGSLPGVRVLARDAARWGGALKRFVSEPFEEVSVDCVHHLFARDAVAKKMESAYFNALTASPIQ